MFMSCIHPIFAFHLICVICVCCAVCLSVCVYLRDFFFLNINSLKLKGLEMGFQIY